MFEAFADLHLLRPWWLLALVPLALVVFVWIRRTRQQSAWSAAISQPLLDVLLDTQAASQAKRLRAVMWLSALLATLALAGPAWEKLPQPVEQKNDALVIVLDLSLSMFAQDVAPSRLEKARQKIVDLLRLRKEGSTGLVAYAGDAHAVVPITDDRRTIENLLSALSPAMMPVLGSRPANGLQLAQQLFSNAGLLEGRILLLTDGIKNVREISEFRQAAFPISIIGIGSAAGAPIPINRRNEGPRYLTDELGNRVQARLDESLLIQAAQQSYGRYAGLTIGDNDLQQVLSVRLPTEDASIEVEREFDIWADMGFWLCLPLVLVMLASFRRGLFAALLVAMFLPEPVYAQTAAPTSQTTTSVAAADQANKSTLGTLDTLWQGLWQRPDQRGFDAMNAGDALAAADLFDDSQWRGAARYRSGDFGGAAGDFGQDTSLQGLYNQGNALARLGRYADAIERYDDVLKSDPKQEDAAFNKALVEDVLRQQEQQQQEQQQQEQQQQNQQQSSDSQGDESEQQQEQQDQQQEQDAPQNEEEPQQAEEPPEEQEAEESEAESAERDEKQEALEQWLRRVPDDPGGLLRRKFQHETKQRLRQGDYSNREQDQIW
jgi:Ca-activated chloride channel family protein